MRVNQHLGQILSLMFSLLWLDLRSFLRGISPFGGIALDRYGSFSRFPSPFCALPHFSLLPPMPGGTRAMNDWCMGEKWVSLTSLLSSLLLFLLHFVPVFLHHHLLHLPLPCLVLFSHVLRLGVDTGSHTGQKGVCQVRVPPNFLGLKAITST